MRKYTSKTEKVEKYSKKYNLPKEEVFRILTGSEDVLTLDELKIKYDNPDMGKLPDWLDEKQLDLIIWNTIHKMYDNKYSYWIEKEDLYMELHIWVRKVSNLLHSYTELKVSCVNHMKFLLQNQIVAQNYIAYNIESKVYNSDSDTDSRTHEDIIANNYDNGINEMEFLSTLESIKDEQVKNLLIAVGYLYSNISCLKTMYLRLLKTCNRTVRHNLLQIQKDIRYNDELERYKIDNVHYSGRKKAIKVESIVKALNYNVTEELVPYFSTKTNGVKYRTRNKVEKPSEFLEEIKYYLTQNSTTQDVIIV